MKEIKPRTIQADWISLRQFSRDELRDYARSIGVPVDDIKEVTLFNLIKSGKAKITGYLGD